MGTSTQCSKSLITRATEFVERNARIGFTLDEIAAYVGVNKYYLCRRFKEKAGITILSLRDIIRIDQAAWKLIRNLDMEVKEVAYEVGYRNPSYFCLRFRQKLGLSPGEFRRSCREGSPFAVLEISKCASEGNILI